VKEAVKKLLEHDPEAVLVRYDNSGGYEDVYSVHVEKTNVNRGFGPDKGEEVTVVVLE